MPLKENQPTTGHLDEESPNTEQRGGRDDGFKPNQPKVGHLDEESKNSEDRGRRDDGFGANVPGVGYPTEESGPVKVPSSDTPQRMDEVKEI